MISFGLAFPWPPPLAVPIFPGSPRHASWSRSSRAMNDEDFEHHHRIHLKIDRRQKRLQIIAEITQSLQAFVNVKKSRLTAHRFISDPVKLLESEMPPNGEAWILERGATGL